MKNMLSGKLPELMKKFKYPMLILALGLVLMLVPTGEKKQEVLTTVSESREESEGFELKQFTEDAEQILGGISGAGRVQVQFTLDTDGETYYLYDETSVIDEGSSELRQETVFARIAGDETPVSRLRIYPAFRGALVLAQGADNPQVVLGIKEAISSLTGLGMDKITVLKMD